MDYEIKPSGMISARHEQSIRKFKKLIGKSGRSWYVAIQDNEADNIYVSADPKENAPGYKGFRGFGGSTLEFLLEDGTTDSCRGPWLSNSDSLYADTGYDVRDKYITFGVVSRGREHLKNNVTVMKDVLYIDEKPTIGSFKRVERIAEEIAEKEGKPVMCYSESSGGSSNGQVKPLWMKNL